MAEAAILGRLGLTNSNTCSIISECPRRRDGRAAVPSVARGLPMPVPAYAELHAHTSFSFLDGASAPADLVERAVELGLSGLAVTDRQGLYGVVRFASAAEEAGLRPVIGIELELVDALAPDPHGLVIPARRAPPRNRRRAPTACAAAAGRPARRAPGPAPAGACPAAGPPRGGQGGPSRRGSGGARAAPRPPGARRDGLPEPLPARLAGQPGRHEGGAAGHPGAPRGARGGARRALGVPPRRDRPAAPGGRPRGRARGRRGLRPGLRASRRAARLPAPWSPAGSRPPASSSSSPITSCPATTGSWRRPRASPARSACRSSSRTTSATRARRIASCTTS